MPAFCYATRIYRTLTFILQWHFWSFNVSFLKKNVWLFLPLAQDRSCIPATLSMENTAKVLPAWGYSYVGDAFVCVICCILRTSGKWRKKMCINKSYICFTTLQYNIVKSMYNMYSFQNYCQITSPPPPLPKSVGNEEGHNDTRCQAQLIYSTHTFLYCKTMLLIIIEVSHC